MSYAESEDVLATAALWRAAGEQGAVATVTETWGSSPRPAGSQMAVTKSGRMAGSVSGGCIEGAVAEAAMKTIDTGSPRPVCSSAAYGLDLSSRSGSQPIAIGRISISDTLVSLMALAPMSGEFE